MNTAPMAADLVPILRAERHPLSKRELEFYDWQLSEAMEDDMRRTHGKNGVPELQAVGEGAWVHSAPGVIVHAVLLLGACAAWTWVVLP